MIPASVHALLKERHSDHFASPEDASAFFWVDWSEDDDQIPGACEAVLKTGQLSADWGDNRLHIVWRGQRTPVPLKESVAARLNDSFLVGAIRSVLPAGLGDMLPWFTRENRDITLRTLNQLLQPAFEIRRVVDPDQSSEVAYVPLQHEDWLTLEQQYGLEYLSSVFAPLPPVGAVGGTAPGSSEGNRGA